MSASTNAVDKSRCANTLQKSHYQYFKPRRSRTSDQQKDMDVDPISLDTTTMGIADTLPKHHAGDKGLLERNLYTSNTKNERISISLSISLSQDSLSNSHFPGTKSLSTSKLLPNLLKYSIEPPSTKRGLQDFIQVDSPFFIKWLPGGSGKTHGKKVCCPFLMEVAVAIHHAQFVYYYGRIHRRDIGVAVLRTTIPVLR